MTTRPFTAPGTPILNVLTAGPRLHTLGAPVSSVEALSSAKRGTFFTCAYTSRYIGSCPVRHLGTPPEEPSGAQNARRGKLDTCEGRDGPFFASPKRFPALGSGSGAH